MTKDLQKAIEILKRGGIVVYPTDTAYGLAVDATNFKAVQKLYALKGRSFKNPIHVIPPSQSTIGLFARLPAGRQELARRLMNKFMPGPITIILPLKSKGKSFKSLSAGTKTIGIRIPDNKIALELAKRFGKPITTTSANISGLPSTYSVTEAKKQFAKSRLKPDFYLDGGKIKKTLPSTVVLLIGKRVKILREGPISETQIKRELGITN